MSEKHKTLFFRIGVILFFIGTIDPMEGSLLIAPAAVIIAIASFLLQKKFWKYFVTGAAMIVFGVAFLWFLSSLGGFGGTSSLSKWWGLSLIPYPLGWLIIVIFLCAGLWGRRNKS